MPESVRTLSAWHAFETPVADYGIGLVGLRENTETPFRVDTLVFRSTPSRSGVVNALLLARNDTSATPSPPWRYAVVATDTLSVNMVEHDYEIAGTPIDSIIVDDGTWVRGLLGQTRDGRWYAGWAQIDSARTIFLKWADRLRDPDLPVYALPPIGRDSTVLSFFATIEGAPVRNVPRQNVAIYATDTVVSRWLRVRVVWPTDECLPPDSIHRTERRLWIQYLDARGRPRVWYHSRGC